MNITIGDCKTPGHANVFPGFTAPPAFGKVYEEFGVFARQEGRNSYLENARGLVVSQDYLPTSFDFSFRTAYRQSRSRVDAFTGSSCLLTTPGAADNYYHWTLDLLPKLLIMQDAGISFSAIDRFVVNKYAHRFQRESLRAIAPEIEPRIVDSASCAYAWHEHVIVPVIHRSVVNPIKWPDALKRLPRLLAPEIGNSPKRNIYVSRNGSARRKVVNEESILAILHQHDFEKVSMDGLDVTSQAEIFRSAAAVVGVHGAALTNLIYCAPGTPVLELFSHHVKPFYWVLSHQMGLAYAPFLAAFGPVPNGIQESQESDLFVDPEELDRALRALLSGSRKITGDAPFGTTA